MAFDRHSGYTVILDETNYLKQVTGVTIRAGNNLTEITPAGLVDRQFVATNYAEGMVEIETQDLATVLGLASGAFATAGMLCDTISTFQFQRRKLGGTFQATEHDKVTALYGFAYPKTLSWQQNGPATLTLEFVPISTTDADDDLPPGLAQPLKPAFNTTIAEAPLFNGCWFGGPVFISTTEQTGIQGVSIDFGIGFQTARSWGPFPCTGSIVSRGPRITLTFADVSKMSSPLYGQAFSSGLTCYFQKATNGGTRVAPDTGQHVSVVASAGHFGTDSVSFRGNEDGSVSLTATVVGSLTVSTTATF